jgi:hypothetical protein
MKSLHNARHAEPGCEDRIPSRRWPRLLGIRPDSGVALPMSRSDEDAERDDSQSQEWAERYINPSNACGPLPSGRRASVSSIVSTPAFPAHRRSPGGRTGYRSTARRARAGTERRSARAISN